MVQERRSLRGRRRCLGCYGIS